MAKQLQCVQSRFHRLNSGVVSFPLSFPIPTTHRSISPTYIFQSSFSDIPISHPSMASNTVFHDFLPLMAEKLGGERLMDELCNGFRLLMDPIRSAITFDSLKKNSAVLGLADLTDDDFMSMMKEGDGDGDGVLNQMEFCVLMFRLSPDLMEQSWLLLAEGLGN